MKNKTEGQEKGKRKCIRNEKRGSVCKCFKKEEKGYFLYCMSDLIM